jgi:ATP-dependent protease HslVU (ClpYQ) peptidase subunit
MEGHQLKIIEQLAAKLQLGQGDIMRLASEIAGEEVASLYDLDRRQTDCLIVALDSLMLAGVA